MGTLKMDEKSAEEYHDTLLETVKAQVKGIMEESVTKKFVHEESEHVLRLCTTIQTCLLDRLRKRTAGFFHTNKIANLFNKVGKSIPEVSQLIVKIEETESSYESEMSEASKQTNGMKPKALYLRQLKQIWVRLALTEKLLDKIVEFLVENSSKFYEKNAMLADPVRGKILSSLLVGPCALEYTKMKTSDHYWSDPPADELLQRQKLHSRNDPSSPGKRPTLHSLSKYGSGDQGEKTQANGGSSSSSFREYVESLHQNSKSTLLYGKNNVVVQPREELYPIPGYLSLHQSGESLYIKWTPNQLMNGTENKHKDQEKVTDRHTPDNDGVRKYRITNGTDVKPVPIPLSFLRRDRGKKEPKNAASFWEYAISVDVQDIIYLHSHQRNDNGGTLVLVGQDGVQRPPICFPPGGHLLSFLTCLETGLLPHGHLDPPLWSQHGKGKVFPRLRNRSSYSSSSSAGSQSEAEEATDFVFRVTTGNSNSSYPVITERPIQDSFDAYSVGSCYFGSQDSEHGSSGKPSRSSLKVLCDTMKRQIISRAFYGWLAHCRHLSTVRTHLSALVLPEHCPLPIEPLPTIDREIWNSHLKSGQIQNSDELMRQVYFGGIEHSLRATVWPFLLNHYPLTSDPEQREKIDIEAELDYQNVIKEWIVVEMIVKKREKQLLAANLAKMSCGSASSSSSSLDGPPRQFAPVMRKQSTMSDVFISMDRDPPHDHHELPLAEENISSLNGVPDCNENKPYNMIEMKKIPVLNNSRRLSDHTPYSSISTEPNTFDRRFSNFTNISESLDTTLSMDSEEASNPKLGNIAEVDRESLNNASDSDPPSSNRKTPPLMKQSRMDSQSSDHVIDMEERNENLTNGLMENQESTEKQEQDMELYYSGAEFSAELLDNFGLNLHRIEKDVHRCDRNHIYFTTPENLNKLRNIMCSYVWKNLDVGYMQGMCDLAAPLLVVMDDESKVYSCFTQLMKRMGSNFPNGGAMDSHFANMRSLLQILDAELFEHMHRNGDYTHFYFCYRWFLLDFKRELSYEDDVFAVWERIWAARDVCSEHFVLFFALALLHNYRHIIIDNAMDFPDIIKFFNEMAERHNAKEILQIAQNFVFEVQSLISK